MDNSLPSHATPRRTAQRHRRALSALCSSLMLLSACSTAPLTPTTPQLSPPAAAVTLCPPMLRLDPATPDAVIVLRTLLANLSDSAAACARMHQEAVEWQLRQIERAARGGG